MYIRLALLFTIVPTIELVLLIAMGSRFGIITTTAVILFTGFVGAWFAKQQGFEVLRHIERDLSRGIPPAHRLAEGALVVVGGVLLITPGILTDLVGFSLISPWFRRPTARRLVRWLARHVAIGDPSRGANQTPPSRKPDPPPFDHPVA